MHVCNNVNTFQVTDKPRKRLLWKDSVYIIIIVCVVCDGLICR